uniref:UBA domain-containing protein n=1 Tax=viral metagenome TaxID=1070528 RepID=A0A6C0EJR2_9ZZZZ
MSLSNVQVHLIEINNIFNNDISIKEDIDIKLYDTKLQLLEYFNNKYKITDSIFIYNNKVLDNLETINISSNKDLIVIFNKIPAQNVNSDIITNIINSILSGNIPELNNDAINNILPMPILNNPLPIQEPVIPNIFEYVDELEQLKSIGFLNINLNKEALIISNGDVEMSINYILEN